MVDDVIQPTRSLCFKKRQVETASKVEDGKICNLDVRYLDVRYLGMAWVKGVPI